MVELEDEVPLWLPASLPAGFSLSSAPVFAQSDDGDSIVLVDFIGEVVPDSRSISVRICQSTSKATAQDYCGQDENHIIRESQVGDIHLIVVTDVVPGPATLNAWNTADFVDYFESQPAWTRRR